MRLADLRRQMASAKARGYAVWHHDSEKVAGIAVPIVVRHQPMAALVVRYYSTALSPGKALEKLLPPLKEGAAQLARALDSAVR